MARGGSRPGAGRKPKAEARPEEPKRLPWRPSKYDPVFCDLVIEAMREGFSLTGFAGQIGVATSTLRAWANEFPDFSAACTIARAARTYCWEERANSVGRRGGGPGTAQIIQFMLKNNAPDEYRDKQPAEVDDVAETARKIREATAAMDDTEGRGA